LSTSVGYASRRHAVTNNCYYQASYGARKKGREKRVAISRCLTTTCASPFSYSSSCSRYIWFSRCLSDAHRLTSRKRMNGYATQNTREMLWISRR
jgi:hypothetical protein